MKYIASLHCLTLKDMAFLLDTLGRGRIPPILGKRTVIPPNFVFEQQKVSHMKAEVFS